MESLPSHILGLFVAWFADLLLRLLSAVFVGLSRDDPVVWNHRASQSGLPAETMRPFLDFWRLHNMHTRPPYSYMMRMRKTSRRCHLETAKALPTALQSFAMEIKFYRSTFAKLSDCSIDLANHYLRLAKSLGQMAAKLSDQMICFKGSR